MADKITKLSQAIRLGATFRPQCRHQSFSDDGASCVLGAANEALTGLTDRDAYRAIGVMNLGQLLMERFGVKEELLREAIRRNDQLQQSREEIADWLETQGL